MAERRRRRRSQSFLSEHALNIVRARIYELGFSQTMWAQEAGVSLSTIQRLLKGERVQLSTLENSLHVLGLNADEIRYPKLNVLSNEGSSTEVSSVNVSTHDVAKDNTGNLTISIDIRESISSDDAAKAVADLCKALNAYHIACGGNGLTIDDWEALVLDKALVGV